MNTQLMVSKSESRAYLKNKLTTFIAENEKSQLDQLISSNLKSLIEQLCPNGCKLIGAYQPTVSEPLLSLPDTLTVSYPLVESKTHINFYTSPDGHFSPSNIGINEPLKVAENLKLEHAHDLIIIPAVGFDQSGYRLGHGGGYYDRYLTNRTKIKIGVGYSVQFSDGLWLPEEHDIQVNYIVTEKYVVKINN